MHQMLRSANNSQYICKRKSASNCGGKTFPDIRWSHETFRTMVYKNVFNVGIMSIHFPLGNILVSLLFRREENSKCMRLILSSEAYHYSYFLHKYSLWDRKLVFCVLIDTLQRKRLNSLLSSVKRRDLDTKLAFK